MSDQILLEEKSVLASMLIDKQLRVETMSMLSEDDFYSEAHRRVYKAICDLDVSNQGLDPVLLNTELVKRFKSEDYLPFIMELSEDVVTYKNLTSHLSIVRNASLLRKIKKISYNANNMIDYDNDTPESVMGYIETEFASLLRNSKNVLGPESIGDLIPGFLERLEKISNGQIEGSKFKSGIQGLDDKIGGLTTYTIIAGCAGMGKTTLAVQYMIEALRNVTGNIIYFSYEMTKDQLVAMVISYLSGVAVFRILRERLTKNELTKIGKALIENEDVINRVLIDCNGSFVSGIRSTVNKESIEKQISGIIVDHIGLIPPEMNKGQTRTQELGVISRGLMSIKQTFDIPVVVLAQLNRDVAKREDGPRNSDLRDSGHLEEDARLILFVHNSERVKNRSAKNGQDIIRIGKHPENQTGDINVQFDNMRGKFVSTDKEHDETMDYNQEW